MVDSTNIYVPNPLDTSHIQLSPKILVLAEEIARNTHEEWASGRIKDGWKLGRERDDVKKLHPCLKPYDELSEQEKDYDRRTSMQALKFMIAKGFEITKMGES